jgi:hypothetical protein
MSIPTPSTTEQFHVPGSSIIYKAKGLQVTPSIQKMMLFWTSILY